MLDVETYIQAVVDGIILILDFATITSHYINLWLIY